MKLRFGLSVFIGLCTSAVFAGETQSELYFQPKGGMSSLEAGLTMIKGSFDVKVGGIKAETVDVNSSVLDLTYLYGISNDMAFGVAINNGTNKSTLTPVGGTASDSKSTGMGDLTLKFLGVHDLGDMNLRYGGDLGLSPGNAKNSSSTSDGNRTVAECL